MSVKSLFTLNPKLDRAALGARFATDRRLQVRDLLTDDAAREVRRILAEKTPWGIAWRAGEDGPHMVNQPDLARLGRQDYADITAKLGKAMREGDYAFAYSMYPILDAYLKKWNPGGPHDLLLEHINTPDFLGFIRDIAGMPDIIKGDAQATLYAPGNFLAHHTDSHVAEGWRLAYVMNFAIDDWRTDWGGYLLFYDEEGDVVQGFRPRFNALNIFAVPQNHAVTYVPPFAPVGRYAITGWFRDR